MVFPYGFYDIIIKRNSLEKCREGLSEELIDEYGLTEEHFDSNLILIPAAMSDCYAEQVVKELETKYGLIHLKDSKAEDFVCVYGPHGIINHCDWIKEKQFDLDLKINDKSYKHYLCFEFVD